jgi:hypothetical protein
VKRVSLLSSTNGVHRIAPSNPQPEISSKIAFVACVPPAVQHPWPPILPGALLVQLLLKHRCRQTLPVSRHQLLYIHHARAKIWYGSVIHAERPYAVATLLTAVCGLGALGIAHILEA